MIYLFYGSDAEKARRKAFEWVEAARKKEPNLAYIRLAREEMSAASLEDAALSGGLFVSRLLVLLDDPFPVARKSQDEEEDEDVSSKSVIEDKLDALAASDNAIIILAPKLSAPKAKKLVAKAAKAYEFNAAFRKDARGFNSGLSDALGAKNSEKLWVELARAMRAGDAPEMLHGLLHWKARNLMENGSRAWSTAEARALSLDLISLLQNSRRGGLGLGESLERFALSLQ